MRCISSLGKFIHHLPDLKMKHYFVQLVGIVQCIPCWLSKRKSLFCSTCRNCVMHSMLAITSWTDWVACVMMKLKPLLKTAFWCGVSIVELLFMTVCVDFRASGGSFIWRERFSHLAFGDKKKIKCLWKTLWLSHFINNVVSEVFHLDVSQWPVQGNWRTQKTLSF